MAKLISPVNGFVFDTHTDLQNTFIEKIRTDYELTGLSTYAGGQAEGATGFRNRRAPYYAAFLDALDKYAPDGTLADKVPRFLMECGVTEAQIAKILSIIKA